jgi:hypothetical protein
MQWRRPLSLASAPDNLDKEGGIRDLLFAFKDYRCDSTKDSCDFGNVVNETVSGTKEYSLFDKTVQIPQENLRRITVTLTKNKKRFYSIEFHSGADVLSLH